MNLPAVSTYLAKTPFEFITWWYTEATIVLYKTLVFIFFAVVHLFSFKLLFTTYFKPWKNEYRQGLVRTAIFIGAFIKTFLIIFDLVLFIVVIAAELFIFAFWLLLPTLPILTLYGAIFAR
jgi:hypothetical protein